MGGPGLKMTTAATTVTPPDYSDPRPLHPPQGWARCLLLLLSLPGLLAAELPDLVLPAVFTDHMVLQCDLPARFWGRAAPGALVEVTMLEHRAQALADATGTWRLELPAMAASSVPQSVRITAEHRGQRQQQHLEDVLVGEVWFCSGQSNMEWTVGKIMHYPGVDGGEAACAKPTRRQLRIFSDAEQAVWKQRGWKPAGGEDLRAFSATAYFFGAHLQRELAVPVGLIHVSRGGSPIQQWIPETFALRDPVIRHYSTIFRTHRVEIEAYGAALHRYHSARRSAETTAVRPEPLPPELDTARGYYGHGLFEHLVQPLVDFPVRGVLWYQGEANAAHEDVAAAYDGMLGQLFAGWRTAWQRPDLPFYVVQLPFWEAPEARYWHRLRDSQYRAARQDAKVYLVPIMDLCDPGDLHPPQKRPVGERLARRALVETYGRPGVGRGPEVIGWEKEGAGLRIHWDDGGAPIQLPDGTWTGVELAGPDGVFHPATAVFEGNEARVTAAPVLDPVALRYGWAPIFRPSLFNAAGFPAPPCALPLHVPDVFNF